MRDAARGKHEDFVLSVEWTDGGEMTVQEFHPGEWEAPLRDDAPALLP
ncbi:MAG: hypothetical protein QOJ15_11841 [Bradyrhizobium sp.]|jgi:hypothetical protein|nr:hypothetical protein [Bradyrhizobium sp.]